MRDLNPTTRRFARSLQDAWPEDYASGIEPPPRKKIDWVSCFAGAVLLVLIAALLV
jgi:hypothetical protein